MDPHRRELQAGAQCSAERFACTVVPACARCFDETQGNFDEDLSSEQFDYIELGLSADFDVGGCDSMSDICTVYGPSLFGAAAVENNCDTTGGAWIEYYSCVVNEGCLGTDIDLSLCVEGESPPGATPPPVAAPTPFPTLESACADAAPMCFDDATCSDCLADFPLLSALDLGEVCASADMVCSELYGNVQGDCRSNDLVKAVYQCTINNICSGSEEADISNCEGTVRELDNGAPGSAGLTHGLAFMPALLFALMMFRK